MNISQAADANRRFSQDGSHYESIGVIPEPPRVRPLPAATRGGLFSDEVHTPRRAVWVRHSGGQEIAFTVAGSTVDRRGM